jgi:hypothetical protein
MTEEKLWLRGRRTNHDRSGQSRCDIRTGIGPFVTQSNLEGGILLIDLQLDVQAYEH